MRQSGSNQDQLQAQQRVELLGAGWSSEQAAEFVARCYDRDALMAALLGYCARWYTRRMLVVLSNQQLQPYASRGWGEIDARPGGAEALRANRVALDIDNPRTADWSEGESVMGAPEVLGFGGLFVTLGIFPPERLLVQSVRVAQRPAIVLLCEASPEAEATAQAEIRVLAGAVGAQLTTIVGLAKVGQLPPTAGRIPPLDEFEPNNLKIDEQIGPEVISHDKIAVPRLAADSSETMAPTDSSTDESESLRGPGEERVSLAVSRRKAAGSTAYGLPFADEVTGSGTVQLQDIGATAYGLPFANKDEDSGLSTSAQTTQGGFLAPGSGDALSAGPLNSSNPSSPSNPTGVAHTILGYGAELEDDAQVPGELNPNSTLSGGFQMAAEGEQQAEDTAEQTPDEDTRTTLSGGYTAADFRRASASEFDARQPASEFDAQRRASEFDAQRPASEFDAQKPASALDSSIPTTATGVPRAQILRPISLKRGRKHARGGAHSAALTDKHQAPGGVEGD